VRCEVADHSIGPLLMSSSCAAGPRPGSGRPPEWQPPDRGRPHPGRTARELNCHPNPLRAGVPYPCVIDLRLLRDDEAYRRGAEAKGAPAEAIAELLDLDGRRRETLATVESLRAESNAASREIHESRS